MGTVQAQMASVSNQLCFPFITAADKRRAGAVALAAAALEDVGHRLQLCGQGSHQGRLRLL